MRFYLVDRITEIKDGTRISGVKNVAMSEDALEFHFPQNPVMPGMLLTEALVQLAGWLEAFQSGFENWFLLDALGRSGYYGFALPGDRVDLVLERVAAAADRRVYRGSCRVDGKRKVETEFEGILTPLGGLEDPEAMRRLFATLSRGEIQP